MPNPTCPPAWETRIPFSQEAKHDAERLWKKVHKLLPQRSRAVEYMKEWMARPGLPAGQPSTPLILDRRYHLDTLGEPIGVVLERAIMHGSTGEPKLLRVKRLGSDSERAKVLGCWRLLRSGTAPNNCELRQLRLNDNRRPLAALRGLATNQMLQDLGDNASILKYVRTRAKLAWATQRLLPASAQPIVCQQCHEPCFMPLALCCASRFSFSLKKTTSAMLDNFTS